MDVYGQGMLDADHSISSSSYSISDSGPGGITAGLQMPAFIQGMEEALLSTVGRKDKDKGG